MKNSITDSSNRSGINDAVLVLPNGFTRRQLGAAITPELLKLTLFPTEKCNFRCTYCYEDFEIGKMSDSLQRGIELLTERRSPELRQLIYSWFGGEPLLAKEIVLRLMKHAHKTSREHGVRFSSGMTTNAYLLDLDLAEELLSYNLDFYQITLDGIGDEHDKLRRRADGAGTFERIWNNLSAMKNLRGEFDCQIRVHVRRDNIPNLELLMLEIKKEFGQDQRFRIDFQHLRNMGGEGGLTVSDALTLPELAQVQQHLTNIYKSDSNNTKSLPANEFKIIEVKNIVEPKENNKNFIAESAGSLRRNEALANEPYICYATKPNNLIIRANGRIGKCTVALNDERNDLGHLDIDGRIVIDQDKHKLWFRGLETLDLETAGCPMKGMPKSEIQSTLPSEPIRWHKKTEISKGAS